MTTDLTVDLHDPHDDAPSAWTDFVASAALPAVWDWSMVRAVTTGRPGVVAGTVRDGAQVRGLVTGRLNGPRVGSASEPLVGVVDIDNLVSGSLPGLVLDQDASVDLHAAAVPAVHAALKSHLGHRLQAVLWRQVSEQLLPAVAGGGLSLVREGGPVAVFRNQFDDLEQYVASLSKNRRSALRRTMRSVESDDDLVVAFTADGDEPAPLSTRELQDLHAEVVDRHHAHRWLRRRLLSREVAEAQLAHSGVHRLTYHDRAGTLVAYATVWDHPRHPLAGGWGMRHVRAGGRPGLWFDHAARCVRWCIRTGRPELIAGQGSLREKVSMGYELRRQWAVLRGVGRG